MGHGTLSDRPHDAGEFSERPFILQFARPYFAFDHDLTVGWHEEVD